MDQRRTNWFILKNHLFWWNTFSLNNSSKTLNLTNWYLHETIFSEKMNITRTLLYRNVKPWIHFVEEVIQTNCPRVRGHHDNQNPHKTAETNIFWVLKTSTWFSIHLIYLVWYPLTFFISIKMRFFNTKRIDNVLKIHSL